MKAIGLDIGTTTISAVVLDMDAAQVLSSVTISNGCDLQTAHPWEHMQDADRIVEKTIGVLDELLAQHPDAEKIGLTGQMHGMLYVGGDGRAVSPLHTWEDQRAGQAGPDGRSIVDILREDFGLKASAGFGISTHCYQIRAQAVPQGAVSLCTIPDYLGMRLCERKRPLQHVSMAASFGCFDVKKKDFCRDELERFGADCALLPEITDDFAVLGTYKGRPVTVAIGDNQASFLGSVGLEENTVLLNIGTGGQISVLINEPIDGTMIESRPLGKGKYIAAGSSLCGGRAYALLERFFRMYVDEDAPAGSQYEKMAALVRKEEPFSNPLRVVTAFNGARHDPSLRGSMENLCEDNFTPGNLIYGVLCGISSELRGMFAEVEQKTGMQIRSLVGSGNGIRRNSILQEIASEQFGAPLKLAPFVEEAACGAAKSTNM